MSRYVSIALLLLGVSCAIADNEKSVSNRNFENELEKSKLGFSQDLDSILGRNNGSISEDSGHDHTVNEDRNATASEGEDVQNNHRLRMSKVFMPTGRIVDIVVPSGLEDWKCSKPTVLVTLNPQGKRGGREYKLISEQLQLTKRQHAMGQFNHYDIVKIQRIVNGCFWKRYRMRQEAIKAEAGYINERMLFHGTNKVKEILEHGFDERYANINGIFGAGLYFQKHSSKSNLYAFGAAFKDSNCDTCERQMLLCRVTMGKTKKETSALLRIRHAPAGYHSIEGMPSPGGLKYPEYVVYRGDQVYPEYLITYKTVK